MADVSAISSQVALTRGIIELIIEAGDDRAALMALNHVTVALLADNGFDSGRDVRGLQNAQRAIFEEALAMLPASNAEVPQ